ncbi:conserved exported hypothetical protein [Arthrobacter sp. 9AX]|uniref:hypothetical protein n=1 Tax=Arthrobacter sp. 9AX TaxID=2653131 RepID=UPI0012F22E2E|nr:hypothetical protein [Arthrobacter sp. 9AX]VXB11049.1 conserved exported hypothetical protein [Arthrobacter sp. 9AX]
MNKLSRILGSTALATGLIFSGSAGAAFANDNDYRDSHKSYDNHEKNKGHDDYKDRGDGRSSYHHGYYRIYVCFDDRGRSHEWRDYDRRNDYWNNCRLITIRWY